MERLREERQRETRQRMASARGAQVRGACALSVLSSAQKHLLFVATLVFQFLLFLWCAGAISVTVGHSGC